MKKCIPKNKKKTLRNKADKLYQQLGMMKHKYCEICGKPANCIHHFYTKGSCAALRYDEDNAIPICQSCHVKHHLGQDPDITVIVISKRGLDWYNRLREKRNAKIKTTVPYYKSIIEHLEGEIINQENQ